METKIELQQNLLKEKEKLSKEELSLKSLNNEIAVVNIGISKIDELSGIAEPKLKAELEKKKKERETGALKWKMTLLR